MLKMVDGTGIIGVDMVCPLGGAVSPPQPPNYDNIEMEGVGSLMLPNSLKAPLERVELTGNSVQGENPAPDNPQEIESVGRKSKNLLIENIYVFTVQDNIAYIPLPEGHETKLYTMLIQKKPGENDDVGFTCGFYDKSNMTSTYSAPCLQAGNLVTGNGIVNSKIGVNHFVCFSPADSRFFDIYNVMYAEGKETTLDYEPYGYLLDVKVTGKNLFNKELIKKAMQGVSYLYVPIYVKKGSKVSFSYSKTLPSGLNFYVLLARDMGASYGSYSWLYHSTATSLCNNEGTFVADNDVISLSFFGSDLDIMIENLFNYLQIEISDKPTPYEPYTEQAVQIVLNEPLRGIGEYKDVLTKDGVVRKIKRIVFDGSEDEKWALSNDPKNITTNRFIISMNIINAYYKIFTMCNKMAWKHMNQVDVVGQSTHGVNFYITLPKDLVPDLQTFRTWLSQNPLTVDYALAEPVTEPLPESVQQQLQALHSENGTTHVFVDSGEVEAGIKLTYRKEI